MELINNNFIKLSKIDIFLEIQNQENIAKLNFFQRLLNVILEYERLEKVKFDYIYMSIKDLLDLNILDLNKIPITRNSLFNATLFAIYSGEVEVAQKLQKYFYKDNIYKEEIPDLFNYVLEHSIDMNEYFNGERKRLVYSNTNNKLEEEYIYTLDKLRVKRVLK